MDQREGVEQPHAAEAPPLEVVGAQQDGEDGDQMLLSGDQPEVTHRLADCCVARHVWDPVAAQLQSGEWGLAGGLLERRHVWEGAAPGRMWDVVTGGG